MLALCLFGHRHCSEETCIMVCNRTAQILIVENLSHCYIFKLFEKKSLHLTTLLYVPGPCFSQTQSLGMQNHYSTVTHNIHLALRHLKLSLNISTFYDCCPLKYYEEYTSYRCCSTVTCHCLRQHQSQQVHNYV